MPTDWSKAIKPLLKKYKGEKHPLEYKNTYQLLVMVILAAQDSDKHINQVAPGFFKVYPTMKALSKASVDEVLPHLIKVRNSRNKTNWLVNIARQVKTDSKIPMDMEQLVELPGIGRKSANVIRRESGEPPEGVMVDLHTARVAPRLGMVKSTDPKKIEEELMQLLPRKQWDVGMSLSFHGREICRPKPLCDICFMNKVCEYYRTVVQV
jgi:endonuclease III